MATSTKKATNKTTRRGFGREQITNLPKLMPAAEQPIDTLSSSTESVTTSFITTDVIPTPPLYTSESHHSFTYVTQIRIDIKLFDSIHNAVESAIFGGNYAIESASHFIREALKDHVSGMPLKVAHSNGIKKSLSIRMNEPLKRFWDTLPKRHRNNILERAVRTKLLGYQH